MQHLPVKSFFAQKMVGLGVKQALNPGKYSITEEI